MPDLVPIRRLGAGYFGEVWLARDRALGRRVAVKYVRPDRIHDPSNFYHEPQALTALRHAHIVEVIDAGTLNDGRLYVVMEYLRAGSVEDRFRGEVAFLAEALQVVIDACYGVEHAHTMGYVHRDIKPANLLVGPGGRIKVSDFGLATKTDSQGLASPVGYVAHLAPEVIESGESSPLADVYALGVTAYRLINGDAYLPDRASLGSSLEEAIVNGDYPPRSLYRSYVPRSLRAVINRAMARNPDQRIPSAAEFRRALEKSLPVVSWRELATAAEAEWKGSSSTHDWLARIDASEGQFHFTIARVTGGSDKLRRVRTDCRSFAKGSEALKHAATVLQRVTVTGK